MVAERAGDQLVITKLDRLGRSLEASEVSVASVAAPGPGVGYRSLRGTRAR